MTTFSLTQAAIAVATSPVLPILGYLVMAYIAGEAISKIGPTRRLTREAREMADFIAARRQLAPGARSDDPRLDRDRLRVLVHSFIGEEVMPLRHTLQRDEVLGPLAGLGFTMLSWCIVMAGGEALLGQGQDHLTQALGLGAGASAIGVMVAALSFCQGKALEIEADRITAYFAES